MDILRDDMQDDNGVLTINPKRRYSTGKIMEAIWIASEMHAVAAMAHSNIALDELIGHEKV